MPKTAQDMPIMIRPRPVVLVLPEYPEACREDRAEGFVRTELEVDENGEVRDARVLKSNDPRLERNAHEALRQWVYEPAIKNGKPMSAVYPVDVDFKMIEKESFVTPEQPDYLPKNLAEILMKVADYCVKLENAALNFFCKEKIVEMFYPGRQFGKFAIRVEDCMGSHGKECGVFSSYHFEPGEENTYIYDYQLIRKDGRFQERRILIEDNSQAAHDVNAYPKTKRFYIDKAIYGPIGLLSREAHPLYNYRLLKQETLGGRLAFIIDIKPKKPKAGNPVYGKVWVDQKDASILKMDIEAESLTGYERVTADYESRGVRPGISIELVYSFEKNGLRYPSRIVLKEAYSDPKEGQIKMSRLAVSYAQYKFFTVETDHKIIK